MILSTKPLLIACLACFEALGYRVSLKVHFLLAHLNYFPQNVGDMSQDYGERFHKDIKSMENLVSLSMGCIHDGGLLLVPETLL